MNLELECNQADSCAHQARWTSAARHLTCLSSPRFLPQCRHLHPEPAYLAPRPPLSESPWSFLPGCDCTRVPRAYLAPRPPPFLLGQSCLCPSSLGQRSHPPLFSLLKSRLHRRLYCTINYHSKEINNYTYLVAVDSFSSARTSQEEADKAQGRRAQSQALALR